MDHESCTFLRVKLHNLHVVQLACRGFELVLQRSDPDLQHSTFVEEFSGRQRAWTGLDPLFGICLPALLSYQAQAYIKSFKNTV